MDNFTGEYSTNNDNGKAIINFVNGLKEGVSRYVDDRGMVLSEITYQNDIIHGEVRQYYPSNGAILSIINYENGIQNGPFISYYENGIKQMEAQYKNAQFDGVLTIYDEFGDRITESLYKSGVKHGKNITYYPKTNGGGMSEYSVYEHGLLEGDKITFYPNGSVLSVTPYINGRAQEYSKTYDRNGNVLLNIQ